MPKKPEKNFTDKTVSIVADENSITVNGVEVTFPIHLNTLIGIFGEPSQQTYHEISWYVVWDDIGVSCNYGSWDNILSIEFQVRRIGTINFEPKEIFTGTVMINGEKVEEFAERTVKLGVLQIHTLQSRDESTPHGFSIGINYDMKVKIPRDKYVLSKPQGEIIEFKDFNFKLIVVQELMYNQELLIPKFDLYEFAEWYEEREIDIEKEGHDFIPEVVRYFKELPVEKKHAPQITEIYQDGGDEIYINLLRFGSGDTEVFDITSAEDVQYFPNLKKVTLCYAKESVLDELIKMGIEAEWL